MLHSITHPHIIIKQADNEFYGQVGDGETDHASWGRPEDLGDMWRPSYKIDTSSPGSDLAGEAAAALAAASMAFNGTNSSLATKYLRHSKQLYDFASSYTGGLRHGSLHVPFTTSCLMHIRVEPPTHEARQTYGDDCIPIAARPFPVTQTIAQNCAKSDFV